MAFVQPESNAAVNDCPGSDPVVTIGYGQYLGFHFPAEVSDCPHGVDVFHGIPFGTDTSGANRFCRARMAAPLAEGEVRDAKERKSTAPETGGGNNDDEGEDCLNLQVYRSATSESHGRSRNECDGGGEDGIKGKTSAQNLPVVVFFHGGSFNFGSSLVRNLRSMAAWSRSPLIVVAANYRLGLLGFLGGAQVSKLAGMAPHEDAPGTLNAGIWDARLALDWVQKYIGAFGGDKTNVSLMGLSAGAHMVGHLLLGYEAGAERPFRRVILESGAPTARCVIDVQHPRLTEQFNAFLDAAGISRECDDPNQPAKLLSAMRALPLSHLCRAAYSVWEHDAPSIFWPFQPVVDSGFTSPLDSTSTSTSTMTPTPTTIKAAPSLLWETSRADRIPLMTGFCTNEGALFVPTGLNTNAEFRAFFARLLPGAMTSADLDELEQLYPSPDILGSPYAPASIDEQLRYGAQWRRLEAAYAHWAYITPVLYSAHMAGSRHKAPARVWEWASESQPYAMSCHGDSELGVTHDMEQLDGLPGLTAVANRMHGLLVDFIVGNGDVVDVGEGGLSDWPLFVSPLGEGREPDRTPGRGKIMVFGKGNDELVYETGGRYGTPWQVRDMTEHEIAACRFWWARRYLSEGMCGIDKVNEG
ncbi:hypothetical protein Cpir12675_005651 [Ceratocystis pirilliformis]|uniref:Carboxylic ester hydrolase n=1 Tax=Ceratocystis pirilliformis TaxID=259994 RepID=A0ABR3YPA3_9PEZI